MEKAKILGDINIHIKSMVNVAVKQEQKHDDFDSYVRSVQNFLQTSQQNLLNKFSTHKEIG